MGKNFLKFFLLKTVYYDAPCIFKKKRIDLQVPPKPPEDVFKAFLAMFWLPASAQLMVLFREPDQLGGYSKELEGGEPLLALCYGTAVVLFAVDD